uniref:Immunoglobulin V-set domain-containing protein n=1 Tax=Moschus moschiferus TaxID=68415 RepID=A0A8C6CM12_MOSMO
MERLLLLLPLLWAGEWAVGRTGPGLGLGLQLSLCVPPGPLQKESLYQLETWGSVTVQAGLCVSTNSTHVYGAWFRKEDRLQEDVLVATDNSVRGGKKKRNIPFHLLGDPRANNCSLGIADAHKKDSGNYYFQLIREAAEHSYKKNQLTVNVVALTWSPDIHIEEPLESSSSSHLKWSLPEACDWGTPPTISWTGAALRPLGLDSKEAYNSSEILLTPSTQDHGTSLTCRVTFCRAYVSAEKTVTLNVSYPPQKLTISISGGIGTGRKGGLWRDSLRLACDTDSNPPATLSWSRGGWTRSPSHSSSELTSRPQLLGPSCSQEDQVLHCSCSSRAWPAPSLRWRLGDGLLAGELSNASFEVASSSAGPWTNGSLSLREGLSSGLSLSCEALNVHRAQSGSVLLLPGPGSVGGRGLEGTGVILEKMIGEAPQDLSWLAPHPADCHGRSPPDDSMLITAHTGFSSWVPSASGFPGDSVGKESACQCRTHGFYPWVGKIPWRRKPRGSHWEEPTPVFLPGKYHAQRSLVGYSPRGRKESDTTWQLKQ